MRGALVAVAVLGLVPSLCRAQAPGGAEQGGFVLHMEMNPIGTERYELADRDGTRTLSTTFGFTDRGRPDTIRVTLQLGAGGPPRAFTFEEAMPPKVATRIAVTREGDNVTVRDGERTDRRALLPSYFTVSGYAPFAVQQELVRYWASHGKPDTLPLLPSGAATIARDGVDTVRVGGRAVPLVRYTVGGVVWGCETLWFDDAMRLVAAVTNESGGNHFEVAREGYESLVPKLVAQAAAASVARLARLVPADPAPPVLALVGATLIDGTGAPPVPDAVVVIRGGKIVAAGSRASVPVPSGAVRVELGGKYLLPGLWDMHAHYSQVEWGPAYLAAGVTTVRDVGNEFEFIRTVRDVIRDGRGLGPRIVPAGFVDGDGPRSIGVRRASSPDRARALVREYHAAGFRQIKIYSSVPPALVPVIAAEAHRLGLTVTGHVPRGMTGYDALAGGFDQINHVTFVARMMVPQDSATQAGPPRPVDLGSADADRAIKALLTHHTVIDPTLAIYEISLHPADLPVASFEPGVAMLPPQLASAIEHSGLPPTDTAKARARFDNLVAIVGALHKAGVPLVAGTDQMVPGHSLHRELELYVRAGLTPMEAIQSATLVPARALRLDAESGTVAAGKRADLLVLDADPLADIHNIRRVHLIIANGRRYDPVALWRGAGFNPGAR